MWIIFILFSSFGWPGDTVIPSSIVPDIEFDELIFDFGNVNEGEQVTHTFIFKNKGDAPLKISQVRTSCGCTAAKLSKKIFPPDSIGEIKVFFNTLGYKGRVKKYIFVHSNDPDEQIVRLEITAMVKVDFTIVPSQISFGSVQEGDTPSKTLEIIPEALKTLKIKNIEAPKYLSVSKKKYKKENKFIYKITVKINKKAPVGNFFDRIKIHTNSEKKPIVEIPVMATIIQKKIIQ